MATFDKGTAVAGFPNMFLILGPYGFNGQLQSDVGYGSGVAVQTNSQHTRTESACAFADIAFEKSSGR